METKTHTFATFRDLEQAGAAVDRLIAAGFSSGEITVLLKDNPASVEFARMKGTKVPLGTEHGPRADEPLEGSLGILYPGEGPKRGVLDDALDGMGVPLDWPHGVAEGNCLISVESDASEKARTVMQEAGAMQMESATLKPTAPA